MEIELEAGLRWGLSCLAYESDLKEAVEIVSVAVTLFPLSYQYMRPPSQRSIKTSLCDLKHEPKFGFTVQFLKSFIRGLPACVRGRRVMFVCKQPKPNKQIDIRAVDALAGGSGKGDNCMQ